MKIIIKEIKEIKETSNRKVLKDCNEISMENSILNGGTLYYVFKNLLKQSNFIVYAIKDNKPIGYVLLAKFSNQLYVMQIAVDKKFQRNGVGKKMYDFIIQSYNKNYKYLLADVRKDNEKSLNFHKKMGFKFYENRGVLDLSKTLKNKIEPTCEM